VTLGTWSMPGGFLIMPIPLTGAVFYAPAGSSTQLP